ncbi:transcription elongation factor GreB [Pseudomonas marginalis]|jgi:transcription elongation factor GreB|nr:transcription elongation factor GreB [Pseudomonas marginalis]
MRGVGGSGYFPPFIYHHPLFVDAGPSSCGVLESMDIAWGCTRLSTKLITKEGHEALKKELDYLWREKRPDTTRKVTWAASLGDRSENADYQYNKKLLREIDRRVRYLRKRLEDMRVVEYMPEQEGRVFFGAWVDIENEQGETKRFRIVGYDEIYERMDYISIDSPMARALLRKQVDDEAIVQTPNGEVCWWITGIEYVK